jgi:hypothetical protein
MRFAAPSSLALHAREGGRDGRVVDGGGLEKLIGPFVEFAIFTAKSARHVR